MHINLVRSVCNYNVDAYSSENLPSGLEINTETGAISGVIDYYLTDNELISTITAIGVTNVTTSITWKKSITVLHNGLEFINVKKTIDMEPYTFVESDYKKISIRKMEIYKPNKNN